jgi:hypothetical protein
MFARRIGLALVLPLVVFLGTLAAAGREDARTVATECTAVEGADVCTWVVTQDGAPLELGATVPISIIDGVPSNPPMAWPPVPLARVALPADAREALGVDHLTINWEAHGHPPQTFMTGHFDFHFYNLTSDEVDRIDCQNLAKPLRIPAGYALPDIDVPGLGTLVGLCVPKMGMHAMPEADERRTDAFHASMIVGYYGGTPTFFEPMVSREMLLRREDLTLPMPAVDGLPVGVRYPTKFRMEYDAATAAYRLVFTGFAPT